MIWHAMSLGSPGPWWLHVRMTDRPGDRGAVADGGYRSGVAELPVDGTGCAGSTAHPAVCCVYAYLISALDRRLNGDRASVESSSTRSACPRSFGRLAAIMQATGALRGRNGRLPAIKLAQCVRVDPIPPPPLLMPRHSVKM